MGKVCIQESNLINKYGLGVIISILKRELEINFRN
jgi:hypothetical protein